MPSVSYLATFSTVDLTALDAVTVYWFGRISAGEGVVWSHGFNSASEISLRMTDSDTLRARMWDDSLANQTEKIFDIATASLLDEHLCVAVVFDLTKTGADQVAPYINGSPADWIVTETGPNAAFGDYPLILGDEGLFGTSPTRCQAFAIFPEAHTQAQVQAVSDDWFEKSGVN